MNDHHIVNRSIPTPAEVRAYYKARSLAEAKIGQRLSEALRKPDISEAARADIENWFYYHEECRF